MYGLQSGRQDSAQVGQYLSQAGSLNVYKTQSLPLVPILLSRMEKGIRTNVARVNSAHEEYTARMASGLTLAQAYCGWPINPGSEKQLKLWLYTIEGLRERRAHGHKITADKDAIAALRAEFLAFDPAEEERQPPDLPYAIGRIALGAHPLLEARVLYVRARHALSHYVTPCKTARIYPEFLIHAQASGRWSINNPPLAQFPDDLRDLIIPDPGEAWIAFDWSQIELRLLAAITGDRALLEVFEKGWDPHSINARDIFWGESEAARLAYSDNLLGLRGGILGTTVVDQTRKVLQSCVSEFKAGTYGALERAGRLSSDCGRWHARLRAPAGGESWPGRGCTPQEWEQARQPLSEFGGDDESRTRAATCAAAWVVCGGPPPGWQGNNDPRRVFAKRFVYRLMYGGDPKSAHKIPGAAALQIDTSMLNRKAQQFLYARREYFAWRVKVQQEILTSRHPTIKTWAGRRRRLLASRGMAAVREAWNHPMQGGAVDILNLTVVRVVREVPQAGLVFTMHDAATFAVPEADALVARAAIQEIAETPWEIGGRQFVIPAKMKPIVYGSLYESNV